MKSHFRFYFVGESRISLRGLAARVYFQGRRERSNEALVLTKAEPTTCHNSEWLMRGKKVEVHSKENIGEFLWGRFHNRMTSLFSSFARISVIKYITCRAYLFRWPAITLALTISCHKHQRQLTVVQIHFGFLNKLMCTFFVNIKSNLESSMTCMSL